MGASKRAHSPHQASNITGWAIIPPHSGVEKRSAVGRVQGMSSHARAWLGPEMVRMGKKWAAAPVISHKKRMKKGYLYCWDAMDVIDGSNTKGPTVTRLAETRAQQNGEEVLMAVLASPVTMIEMGMKFDGRMRYGSIVCELIYSAPGAKDPDGLHCTLHNRLV